MSEEIKAKIRTALEQGPVRYQCCFCRNRIEGDITALILVTRWNEPEEKQRSQQWFCHAECFTQATGERIDVLRTDA